MTVYSYNDDNNDDIQQQLQQQLDLREEEDLQDIQLAHEYRLKIKIPPRQSSFRVVAIVFYELLVPDEDEDEETSSGIGIGIGISTGSTRQKNSTASTNNSSSVTTQETRTARPFVVGTNDEPCYIGGSICAERAALVQLRFLPIKKITKIVISTDAHHPVYPGMLCREFMSSHMYVGAKGDVPIVTAGCVCLRIGCGVCLDKQTDDNEDDDLIMGCRGTSNSSTSTSTSNTSSSTRKNKFHDWEFVKTFLKDLYPYPSPYTRLTALESVKLGMDRSKKNGDFWSSSNSNRNRHSSTNITSLSLETQELIRRAVQEARATCNDRLELHPIQYAAAIKLDNGHVYTASQWKTLECGCSVDAITQMASSLIEAAGRKCGDNGGGGGGRPTLIVQVDQYGVIHAPFATARAFLSEYGFGDCRVLIQKDVQEGQVQQEVWDVDSNETENPNHHTHYQIMEVTVKDLAPNVPELGRLY